MRPHLHQKNTAARPRVALVPAPIGLALLSSRKIPVNQEGAPKTKYGTQGTSASLHRDGTASLVGGRSARARAGHGDTVTVRRPLAEDNIVSQSILF